MARGTKRVWGIGAEFDNAQDVFHAAEKIRDLGFQRWDVHSPYPIHGMDAAMGLGSSKLSFFSLVGGITGFTTAVLLIYLTGGDYSVPEFIAWIFGQSWYQVLIFNYPIIVHGKPFFAPEPSVPIFFELTVLLTAFFSIFALMALTQLPRWNHPLFNWNRFKAVTDDKFFIVIEAADPRFAEDETRELLSNIGGKSIALIED